MTDIQSRVARRIQRPWRVAGLVIAVVIVAPVVALASVLPFSSETARRKVIEVLSARLDAEVELSELRCRAIRHRGRRDVPPLISIKQFSAEGNVFGLLRKHIARLTVDELDIEFRRIAVAIRSRNGNHRPQNHPNMTAQTSRARL